MNFKELNLTYLGDWPIEERVVIDLVSFFGIIFNSLTLIVLLFKSKKIFTPVGAVFAIHLSLAHLFFNIATLTWFLFGNSEIPNTKLHDEAQIIQWGNLSASFLSLGLMTFERVLVIVYRERKYFKKSFARTCIGLTWIISACSTIIMIHNVVIGQMIVIVLFEICLLFSVVSYIKIFIKIRDLDIYRSLSTARYSADNNQVSIGIERNQHCRRVAKFQESGLTNVPIILWIIVVITVMPYMLVMQGFLMREIVCSYCGLTKFATYVIEGLYPIKILNFGLTPFVYAWQLPKFRKMFKKTFCDFFICRLVSRNIFPPTTIALSSSSTTDDSDALTPCSGRPGINTTPLEEDYTDSLTCVCTRRSSSSTATYTDSSTASFGTCCSNTMAGTGSPTEMAGTGSPTEMAGTGGPTEMAGTGGPTEMAGTGSPTEMVGTGSPTEMVGTGSPTEMVGTGSPTEMVGSGGSSAIPATVCSFAIYHDHPAMDDNVNSTLA